MNEAAKAFNKQLYALYEQLRSEMKDATIVHVDIYSIKYGVISNPSIYGMRDHFPSSFAIINNPPM